MNGAGEPDPGGGGYKRRYRALKRRLKFLIYEQECFQEELRKAQRKLLKVSRDKSFLLDRLLQYENVDEESSGKFKAHNFLLIGCFEDLASPPYAPFPSDYLALGPEPGPPQPDTNATRSARRPPRPRKLKLPMPPASHSDCSPVVVGLPFPSPRGTPKLPPPTILSTVPHQMFSDTGEGSGEDPLDGDDELVIDIPE
ncbi:hypothetical protein JD844_001368 [Phrynosoma platyrhinos]|uniref:INO80 complex subunit E N-terminal domain-containing protein n=1 Tax=Phrynosoma platyrhinos TaxID=52577 RepID=A0ABQ7TA46_PHRPL|nr:hypothetical protein JD844_001368 [Phrynosoma platyrhinos]